MKLRDLFKPTLRKRILFFLGIDTLFSMVTLYFSYALRFNFHIPPLFLERFLHIYAALLFFKILYFSLFKLYHRSWRFFSLLDFGKFLRALTLAYLSFFFFYLFFREWFIPFPRSVVIIDYFLSILFLGGIRIGRRLFTETFDIRSKEKAVVIGATPRGAQIIKSAILGEIPYHPVALIAPDQPEAVGTYVENVKVYTPNDLNKLVKEHQITTALIAQKLPPRDLDRLLEQLAASGIRHFKFVNLLSDSRERLKDIHIEDLLARDPKGLDTQSIAEFISGKTVLITGAGGSIGSELCRQCLKFGADKLVLVEQSEYNLYKLTEELPSDKTIPALLSTLDKKRLQNLFEVHHPEIVIHAAAYKHVPLCEKNVDKAIENNILGSINVIELSIAYGVKKVVNISTDKAVRPTNVMGATKRVVELYAQNVPSGKTEIVSVRFGNVLGSSGSVIPKFKQQIERGGPVTVTHPEITRFFMLIEEACMLVLQAAAMAEGGELYILDMGKPVKIVDLARKMIQLYGKEGEIDIVFTGLREGEKLYEELLIDDAECKTKHELIFIAKKTPYPFDKLKKEIEKLLHHSDKIAMLRKIVPEYHPNRQNET